MQAYVINLERTPLRLSSFLQHMQNAAMNEVFHFIPITAVDGHKLDLESLAHRVSEANREQITRIRGHLGCALSHVECWRRIAEGTKTMAIFEDDARIVDGVSPALIRDAITNLPTNANLVWLNDYNYWAREGLRSKVRRKLSRFLGDRFLHPTTVNFIAMPDVMTTMEAYVVSPTFARSLCDGLVNNLGAIDRHVQLFIGKSGSRVLQSNPALFTQADRSDSATRF